jgi:DNA-binding transcriptional ArsR family regulator/uncharacterized protein YndB with AHSA1/START domain
MDARPQLAALADPTRRSIFEMLTAQPRSVGALSEELPVSRPAVSQHLKVLADAGLVSWRQEGTRRIYSVRRAGLAELSEWLDAIWDHALDRYEAAARREHNDVTDGSAIIPPVIKTRQIPIPVEDAFRLFTEGLDTWWPLHRFSVGVDVDGTPPTSVRFEERVGGRVVEVGSDGTEYTWAEVIGWQPPHRFVLAWHPAAQPKAASILEVRFSAAEGGSELYLEHRAWEEFGDDAIELRDGYEPGWDTALAPFEAAAGERAMA